MKINDIYARFHYSTRNGSPADQSKIQMEKETSPASKGSRAKSETLKREQKNKETGRKLKRPVSDADLNGIEEESVIPIPNKKRRSLVPESSSDDSKSDQKSDASGKEEDNAPASAAPVKAVSKRPKQPTKTDEDESPNKKKLRLNNGKSRGKSCSKQSSNEQQYETASDVLSWPQLTYDFLQPGKIKDKNKRSANDPDYDPKTVYVPDDFMNKQTPTMRQWWISKSEHYDVDLFFKVGAFYEFYHMDAFIGNNELDLKSMEKKNACSGFKESENSYSNHSAKLIEKVRIEQTESVKMKDERVKKMLKPTKYDKVVKREICQISSRGTRICTSHDAEISSTYLLSIIEKNTYGQNTSTYGVCFIDTTIGEFNLGQFQDDKCSSRLLTLLAHYPPAHIIYECKNLTPNTMKIFDNYCQGIDNGIVYKNALRKESQFWSSTKVLKYIREAEYFKTEEDSKFTWPKGIEPYLNKADSLGLLADEEKELAVTALGGCVYLLKEYQLDQRLLAQGRFKTYTPPDLTGEATSKLPLNMILDSITIHNLRVLGNDNSLIKTLDNCTTAFGKRLLREWICRPSCRKDVIVERQKAISELLDNLDVAKEVSSKLINLPDLERLLSKIQGNAVKLHNHPYGRAIFGAKDAYLKRTIGDFESTLNGFKELLNIIEQFADFKNPLINKCTQLGPEDVLQELIDPDLLARETAAEEQEYEVLRESSRKMFAEFIEHVDKWRKAVNNVAIIDCLISLAEYVQTCNTTCIPHIQDDTDNEGIVIEIKEGKHPCVVSEDFISNDILIASSAPLMILTGPNMGGKSTLMRQIGLITIMAQIGCHVPASDCRLTLVDRIFTRLGASDDIVAGQSTFMVELSETATILHHPTKFSMILLDELGRGTSTHDGIAITASVVEALTKVRCRTIFSTHYHSLIEDYKANNNVTFAHMACMVEYENEDQVSEENITFLYKYREGACPKSYGFSTAQLAGMPTHITKRAREIATKLETEVNLRHTFTALCKLEDDSLKGHIQKVRTLLLKN